LMGSMSSNWTLCETLLRELCVEKIFWLSAIVLISDYESSRNIFVPELLLVL